MSRAFTIGLDYGTNSVRAVVIDCADGRTVGTSVFDYPSGDRGVLVDPRDPHLARQNPVDYLDGLEASVTAALTAASGQSGFSRVLVIGIGVAPLCHQGGHQTPSSLRVIGCQRPRAFERIDGFQPPGKPGLGHGIGKARVSGGKGQAAFKVAQCGFCFIQCFVERAHHLMEPRLVRVAAQGRANRDLCLPFGPVLLCGDGTAQNIVN